MQYKIICHS